jgi:hypothetical protein
MSVELLQEQVKLHLEQVAQFSRRTLRDFFMYVYTFICVEIKTNIETVSLGMFQKVQRTLVLQDQFLYSSWSL